MRLLPRPCWNQGSTREYRKDAPSHQRRAHSVRIADRTNPSIAAATSNWLDHQKCLRVAPARCCATANPPCAPSREDAMHPAPEIHDRQTPSTSADAAKSAHATSRKKFLARPCQTVPLPPAPHNG